MPGRLEDPPGQPVEIEQIGHEALELPRVLSDPGRQFPAFAGFEFQVVAAQRDGQPEDRCQWRPQVVGNGLQEGVLHLVRLAQTLGGFALHLERARQLLFGLPPLA